MDALGWGALAAASAPLPAESAKRSSMGGEIQGASDTGGFTLRSRAYCRDLTAAGRQGGKGSHSKNSNKRVVLSSLGHRVVLQAVESVGAVAAYYPPQVCFSITPAVMMGAVCRPHQELRHPRAPGRDDATGGLGENRRKFLPPFRCLPRVGPGRRSAVAGTLPGDYAAFMADMYHRIPSMHG